MVGKRSICFLIVGAMVLRTAVVSNVTVRVGTFTSDGVRRGPGFYCSPTARKVHPSMTVEPLLAGASVLRVVGALPTVLFVR